MDPVSVVKIGVAVLLSAVVGGRWCEGGHDPRVGYAEGAFSWVMKCRSHYSGAELPPHSYFASPGAGARDKGRRSEYRAEGRSCDGSFVFTDFFAFQSQISSSTLGLSLDIYTPIILDDVKPPCSSMAKADPFF